MGRHDIVTELVFPDRAACQNWVSTMYAAGSGIVDDEIQNSDLVVMSQSVLVPITALASLRSPWPSPTTGWTRRG